MNHASLFSGIGGAEVAASMMGWKNLFHCEIQEFPRKVLDYWFPNSESYEDITKTDFTKWGVRSMFSQEDSHANLSPSQVEERERTITVTSGLRCFERYGRYTPLGSLVKTLLASRRWWSPAKSLRWDAQTIFSRRITYTVRKAGSPSTKSVQTSKPKDIPSNRLLFQLVPSEHRTEEIESGLLPTPNAMDIPHKNMEINGRGRRNPKKGKTDHSLGLEDMAVAQLSSYTNGMRQRKWANKQKPINWCCRTDSPQDRWRDFPTQSPVCRGNDGIPFDVDSLTISFPKWRQESIKAYGNAWVPQVAYEIFKAIEVEEKKTTK